MTWKTFCRTRTHTSSVSYKKETNLVVCQRNVCDRVPSTAVTQARERSLQQNDSSVTFITTWAHFVNSNKHWNNPSQKIPECYCLLSCWAFVDVLFIIKPVCFCFIAFLCLTDDRKHVLVVLILFVGRHDEVFGRKWNTLVHFVYCCSSEGYASLLGNFLSEASRFFCVSSYARRRSCLELCMPQFEPHFGSRNHSS